MSSECLVESCREGQEDCSRLEKQEDEEEDNQPAESQRWEEPEGEGSPNHSGTKEATSDGGLEQVQVEKEIKAHVERKKFGRMSVNLQRRDKQSGRCLVERYLSRTFPRGLAACSYPVRRIERQVDAPRGSGPFFYFGGTNGVDVVSSYCENRGWRRIYNKHREDFKLKWCETKSTATYYNFREGEQLVYQIPNNKVLTTKIGLLSSLREYERVSSKVNHGQGRRRLNMDEFIPTTFRMDVREEREAFFSQCEGENNNSDHMWICKPTGLNQGRGIFLLKSQEDVAALRLKLKDMEDSQVHRRKPHLRPQAHIVQQGGSESLQRDEEYEEEQLCSQLPHQLHRATDSVTFAEGKNLNKLYIQRPLLLKGKKFDVRSYLLIACTAPYMVFFRHGYVRLTCDLYDPSSNNLSAHLTNQYMQKKNPLYSQLKEDTVWSMESFNAYVNNRFQVARGLPRDWVLGAFAKRMQRIMTQCFLAVKSKFDCRLGFFDLIGCDFMVDEDFKVWLLEMNCNPALHVNCEVLREVIPSTVVEMLDLTLEIFNKRRLRQRIFPLASQREFVLLYSGFSAPDSALACSRSKTDTSLTQKMTEKNQKIQQRGCKSGAKGKTMFTGSLDNSVYVNGEERPGLCLTTSTSPLHPSSVQSPSDLATTNSRQTCEQKKPRPRVELGLSKCTLHQAADKVKHSKAQPKTLLSSPELADGLPTSPDMAKPHPPHGVSPECDQQGGQENGAQDCGKIQRS